MILTTHRSGINGQREAIRVKHLWGEWKSPLASVAFGRMPNHWGLGIMANAGQCIDCDFGDAVDRLMGTILLFDTYLAIGWDFADEGGCWIFWRSRTFKTNLMDNLSISTSGMISRNTPSLFSAGITKRKANATTKALREARNRLRLGSLQRHPLTNLGKWI